MKRFYAWIVLAFLAAHALAAPTGNTTATTTGSVVITTYGKTHGLQATFAAEPRGRGTVSILISCSATFFFCVWTAMHPNIIPGVSGWRRFYYKVVLMFVSILIPEGVLICAMGQYRDAKALRKAWRQCDNIPPHSKHMMDMRVAFFVVMGGFVVDEEELPPLGNPDKPTWWQNFKRYLGLWKPKALTKYLKTRILPEFIPPRPRNPVNLCRAILTPSGFRTYLDDGLIHDKTFDMAMIDDKCKANMLAKVLAGAQALWLVAECAARWNANLPLTLLEIHVLIQVVRTALIYGFWWEKPLDVNEPIVIKLAKRDPLLPISSPMSKDTGATLPPATSAPPVSEDAGTTLLPATTRSPPPVCKETGAILPPVTSALSVSGDIGVIILPAASDPETQTDHPGHKRHFETKESMEEEINRTRIYRPNEPEILAKRPPHNYISINCKVIYDILTQIDIGPRSGREYYVPKPAVPETDSPKSTPLEPNTDQPTAKKNTKRVGSAYGSSIGMLVESLLVCLTGALHAIAWNSSFPTIVEQWLWRISSLAMCFCCLGIFLIANFTEYEQDLISAIWDFHISNKGYLYFPIDTLRAINKICDSHSKDKGTGKRHLGWYICHQLGIWIAVFFVSVYIFSVLYITVESYLSLRSPKHGVFVTVGWIDYWPHL